MIPLYEIIIYVLIYSRNITEKIYVIELDYEIKYILIHRVENRLLEFHGEKAKCEDVKEFSRLAFINRTVYL